MAMKESPRSLMAYFIIVGVISGGSAAMSLPAAQGNVIALAVQAVALVFAVALIVTGLLTPKLLQQAPIVLYLVVAGTTLWNLLIYALVFVLGAGTGTHAAYALVTLAVGAYLIWNIRRLSQPGASA